MKTTKTEARPLGESYRKPWRKLLVRRDRLGKPSVLTYVSPVLYHGTEKVVVQHWLRNGVESTYLSLTSGPETAVLYTDYKTEEVMQNGERISLLNGMGRRISVRKWQHPQLEFARLLKGLNIGSVAMFDRDQLLEGNGDVEAEEGWGILVRPKGRQLDLSAMFGVLEFSPLRGDLKRYVVWLRVLNPKLWQENFTQAPPFKRKIFQLDFDRLQGHQIVGRVLGHPQEYFRKNILGQ